MMSLIEELRDSNLVLFTLSSFVIVAILRAAVVSSKVNVPVVGSDALFGYLGALWAATAMRQLLTEGYEKYNSRAFQIPALRSWLVFVSGKYIDEVRKAPENTLSFTEEVNEILATNYTMGRTIAENPWHVIVLRKQLTSNLGAVFPDVYDEIQQAFKDELVAQQDQEWISVVANDMIVRVVCRASNRMFVGLPLCRNPEYTKISRDVTMTVVKHGFAINLFPAFLRPIVGRLLTRVPSTLRRFETFVVPLAEERYRLMAEYGEDWKDKPNDLLQWLMDTAEGDERSPKALTTRLLALNFAAIHTSSMSFTHAIYYLAANPQFADPLREEVEEAVKEFGWTKDALNAMNKLDSFLKETMRCTGIGMTSMQRKVLKPFTFSDGTTLPRGAHLSVNAWAVHHDPNIYSDPDTFDPFRFSRLVEQGENPTKQLFTTTSAQHLTFGHGAHACPGRYFASQELKAMLAHLVLHYDIRMPQEGVRPPDLWLVQACIPDRKARVLFRKREA